MSEKKTEGIKVWLSEPLLLEIARMANAEDRTVSEYIRRVLQRYVYGNRLAQSEERLEVFAELSGTPQA